MAEPRRPRRQSPSGGGRRRTARPATPAPDLDGPVVELDIERVAHGGVFVAHNEGRVVFVPDAIPGERVSARITDRRHDRFCRPKARAQQGEDKQQAPSTCHSNQARQRKTNPDGVRVKKAGCDNAADQRDQRPKEWKHEPNPNECGSAKGDLF